MKTYHICFSLHLIILYLCAGLLLSNQLHCIASDNDLLVGRNYYYLHLTVVSRDDSFLATNLVVHFLVDLDTEILQVLAGILAEVGLVLTYTSCKSVSYTHLTLPTNREV